MSFEYDKLRGRIKEKFGTQAAFAKKLGVSERTLSLKLNGKIFFSQDEIKKGLELLELQKEDVNAYFFNEKVQ